MLEKILPLRARALELLKKLRPLALLLGRLAVGLIFISTGWGKVHGIENLTHFFIELHIPAPGLNAVVVAWTELLGGMAIILGLFARLAALPLAFSMLVAILTAKLKDLHGLFDLVGFEEFTYLTMFVMIAILGPGKISLDHLLAKRFGVEEKAE